MGDVFVTKFGDKYVTTNGDKFSESPNLVTNMSLYLVTNSVSHQIRWQIFHQTWWKIWWSPNLVTNLSPNTLGVLYDLTKICVQLYTPMNEVPTMTMCFFSASLIIVLAWSTVLERVQLWCKVRLSEDKSTSAFLRPPKIRQAPPTCGAPTPLQWADGSREADHPRTEPLHLPPW